MRTRHRIPTLFTLSMLDVFCCALGCVILLWLWNQRLAKMQLDAADKTNLELRKVRDLYNSTRDELASARSSIQSLATDLANARSLAGTLSAERDQLRTDLTNARNQVAGLSGDKDRLTRDLASARKDLTDRMNELTRTRAQAADLADQLAKKTRDQEKAAGDLATLLKKTKQDEEALKAEITKSQKRVADLEVLMRNRDKDLTVATAKSKNLADQLHDLEGQLRAVRAKADTVGGLQANLDDQTKRLAAADSRMKELEQFLNNRKSIMIDMQGKLDELKTERKSLSDEIAKLRVAADNRFAGIQLTGRRVVFLVDMSGSMKMADAKTAAPEKWPTVIETLVKVMKSLPDLEKFQVVLFAESIIHPVGGEGDLLNYDPATSADKVKQALSTVDPGGNTNMYSAFEAVFRLRAKGMDTIYLLSDGLPNLGPGLSTEEQARQLADPEKGVILGRYIRQVLRDYWNAPGAGGTRVRINSIGFFYESPDLGAFLWALAREHDGSFVGMSKP